MSLITKRAVVYCRVSTEDQAREGISLETQVKVCSEAAVKEGFKVVSVLRDEGKSGGTMNRAGMQEVIRLVTGNLVEAVYAIHTDRIARNVIDHLIFKQLLRDKGVALKCIYSPMLDESATSRTMDTMIASFNEMQRLITSEKVTGAMNAKAEAGYFPSRT